jgi:hypothetical protein
MPKIDIPTLMDLMDQSLFVVSSPIEGRLGGICCDGRPYYKSRSRVLPPLVVGLAVPFFPAQHSVLH